MAPLWQVSYVVVAIWVLRTARQQITLHGTKWHHMVPYGIPWHCMAPHGGRPWCRIAPLRWTYKECMLVSPSLPPAPLNTCHGTVLVPHGTIVKPIGATIGATWCRCGRRYVCTTSVDMTPRCLPHPALNECTNKAYVFKTNKNRAYVAAPAW